MNLSRTKKKELLFLLGLDVFAVAVTLIFKTNFLFSTFLFLTLPSFYLISKERKNLLKITIASIALGGFFGFTFDFINELNGSWDWNGGLLFGQILGVVQGDVIFWFFFWIFHVLVFYEHFIDRSDSKFKLSKTGLWVLATSVFSVIVVIAAYSVDSQLLLLDKAYLKICSVIILILILMFIQKPKIVIRSLLVIPYFFLVYISHELTALYLGQWKFPGDYIGWVNIGNLRFPIEEFIFWIILSSLAVSVYYELLFDNERN